jgi:cation diffusion facilitator CzcD-associated flavoprotein CzcO
MLFFMLDHEVAIVGAGIAGIGAAIKLKQEGIDDFVIIDQADDVGGTWRDNTYPGLAVDVPSFSYQYSFELNPRWSRDFAPGAEVKRYVDHCVDKYGLREHLRLGTEVHKAVFDDATHSWRLHVPGGEISSRYVITATGGLVKPKLPDIEGLQDFAGTTIHTARWDHDHDLRDERIAVIGTGATAVQLLPQIAPAVRRLYVYQRTPIWVLPKPDVPTGPLQHAFRFVPGLQNGVRLSASAIVEVGMVLGVMYNRQFPFIARSVEELGKAWIRRQVSDPVLQDKLTPRYGFGCKRPSVSNTYYPTFNRENTTLVTDPIERITTTGIRTRDGVHREIDTLILATGYFTTELENLPPVPVYGRDGFDLGEFFRTNRLQSYEGTSLPRVPNAFAMFGPYAFSGSSWMFMVENQAAHALRVIKEARKRGATLVEVTQEANDRFFAQMIGRQGNTIFFNNRCQTANSYYFDSNGDAPFVRPSTAVETWWRARHFDLDDYTYERVA